LSVVLADLGGTHLRLARADDAASIQKYTIADHDSLEAVLKSFAPDISALYLASAVHPLGGVIEDKRFGEKSHWVIDLHALQTNLGLQRLVVLNDLEAAAHALSSLSGMDLHTVIPASQEQIHFDHPPKLLIGVGTGIGHAYLFEKAGHAPFVQRSHGGHVPAMAVSDEQKKIVTALSKKSGHGRDLIVEDIVSGNGFKNLKTVASDEDALRLFWEFLGLYCNTMTGISGAYGGIYLTGGMMSELFAESAIRAKSFAEYFHRPLVPVLLESLASTPVYYCRQTDMPIAGLAAFAKVNA